MNVLYKINGEDFYELSEESFYPPEDDRTYISDILIEDIEGGENFIDYVCWFYNMYGNDIFEEGWDSF